MSTYMITFSGHRASDGASLRAMMFEKYDSLGEVEVLDFITRMVDRWSLKPSSIVIEFCMKLEEPQGFPDSASIQEIRRHAAADAVRAFGAWLENADWVCGPADILGYAADLRSGKRKLT
jgi:hypothetical protein